MKILLNLKITIFSGIFVFMAGSFAYAQNGKVPCQRSLMNLQENIEGPRLSAESRLNQCQRASESIPSVPEKPRDEQQICSIFAVLNKAILDGTEKIQNALQITSHNSMILQDSLIPQFEADTRNLASISECSGQYISGASGVKSDLENAANFCSQSTETLQRRLEKFSKLQVQVVTIEYTLCNK